MPHRRVVGDCEPLTEPVLKDSPRHSSNVPAGLALGLLQLGGNPQGASPPRLASPHRALRPAPHSAWGRTRGGVAPSPPHLASPHRALRLALQSARRRTRAGVASRSLRLQLCCHRDPLHRRRLRHHPTPTPRRCPPTRPRHPRHPRRCPPPLPSGLPFHPPRSSRGGRGWPRPHVQRTCCRGAWAPVCSCGAGKRPGRQRSDAARTPS
mmetsp:Transcript_37834/g.106974  ORF Transcript_37834/g.106974 Transcript_37834/m.106974 type:complete len:209 (-) Transcript_37834:699-1325(-)